jgi:hypothetical protein
MKERVKGGLRLMLFPVLRYFGPRFQNVYERLDQIQRDLNSLNRRLDDFERHITTDMQTGVEVLLVHQRSTAILQERIGELKRLIDSPSMREALEETQEPQHYPGPPGPGNGQAEVFDPAGH